MAMDTEARLIGDGRDGTVDSAGVFHPVDAYLTIDEASRLAKVSKRTVYNWITAGKVAVVERPSGSKLVVRASLLRAPAAGESTVAIAIQVPTVAVAGGGEEQS